MPTRCSSRRPRSGTARWARSSSSRSRPAHAQLPRRSLLPPARPWWAAATPPRRWRASGWRTRSRMCRPAAGRRSSCWRAKSSPAWRRSTTVMADRRRPLIAGNWKMNKTNAEAAAFLDDFVPGAGGRSDVDVAICAPYTALHTVAERTAGTPVIAGAQNMHDQDSGAFTGEVSASMLRELGVEAVVLGHSERRQLFGETDAALQRKVPAALAAELLPILCVGETEEEREAGEMERKLRHQVQLDLAEVAAEDLPRVVVAYEPIWAIGT